MSQPNTGYIKYQIIQTNTKSIDKIRQTKKSAEISTKTKRNKNKNKEKPNSKNNLWVKANRDFLFHAEWKNKKKTGQRNNVKKEKYSIYGKCIQRKLSK